MCAPGPYETCIVRTTWAVAASKVNILLWIPPDVLNNVLVHAKGTTEKLERPV